MIPREFLGAHRDEILSRSRLRVSTRATPAPTVVEITDGLPLFLDQLSEALRRGRTNEAADHSELRESVTVSIFSIKGGLSRRSFMTTGTFAKSSRGLPWNSPLR